MYNNMVDPAFKINTEEANDSYGRFSFEPLPVGYGQTLGVALRRVLLSSLSGAAVVSVKIDGVKHQFQTLEGLKEDIVEFVLNLKKLRVRLHDSEPAVLTLDASGPGTVTAADIKVPSNVEILNEDLHLGTLADKKSKLVAEITVEKGWGYSPADERKSDTIGLIPVDASFTPIMRVNYDVLSTRVGRETNLDKLVMEVWTDGTIGGLEAIQQAAKVLVSFYSQIYDPKVSSGEVSVVANSSVSDDVLKMLVEELDLPTRLENALKNGAIETVGQLIATPRKELLKIKNLGGKSLDVVEERLKEKGVSLSIN